MIVQLGGVETFVLLLWIRFKTNCVFLSVLHRL